MQNDIRKKNTNAMIKRFRQNMTLRVAELAALEARAEGEQSPFSLGEVSKDDNNAKGFYCRLNRTHNANV
jgi:hypothetical protein